ncbi:hypothetical protein Mapa_012266 [Marchantia paleacea]|nr:hypothetical protein Mapa_012266 [Marchantia paleacea]
MCLGRDFYLKMTVTIFFHEKEKKLSKIAVSKGSCRIIQNFLGRLLSGNMLHNCPINPLFTFNHFCQVVSGLKVVHRDIWSITRLRC